MANSKPLQSVLLTLDKPLQDSITTESGIKFYLDPSYNKNWQATVTARVAAIPVNPFPKDKKIISQLKVGDEVCISYQVVYDMAFGSDSGQFIPATKGDERMRTYINGRGDKIEVCSLPGKITPIWIGYLVNKRNEHIDGVQGSESDVDRWLSQFPIGKTDKYVFNNLFSYEGEDYWKCEPSDIYAKKVKGHLVAVGEKVICQPIDEKVPKDALPNVMHSKDIKLRYQDRAKVMTCGKEKGLKRGMVVSFNPSYLERYTFYGKNYYIINQNRVLGIWQGV